MALSTKEESHPKRSVALKVVQEGQGEFSMRVYERSPWDEHVGIRREGDLYPRHSDRHPCGSHASHCYALLLDSHRHLL